MASSFIEDILGSEVDEKAVSAVVGSLESQLASPSSSASSSVGTVKTLPLLQRSGQVPSASSSAASNTSQNNNSVAATITNNTAASLAITAKSSYHTNSTSGAVSTPINIAPRPVVTTAVSLAPRTVTLLSSRSGARGYLPVQGGIGLPLMMGPVGGQMPLAPGMVPGALSLPRTATPQNFVPKPSSQVHNVQQTGSPQRIAINQGIKHEQRLGQSPILNNNLHSQTPTTVQVTQNHTNLLVKSVSAQGSAVNHVPSTVFTKTGTVTTTGVISSGSTSGTAQSNMSKMSTEAQVNHVREQVAKLQGFFTKLTDLATAQSPAVGEKVRGLIKAVMVSECFAAGLMFL